jgi:hypothetical protein
VYSTHLTDKKSPVNIYPEANACWNMGDVRVVFTYIRCSMWFPCTSTQLSAFRHTVVRILLKISGFTQLSRQAFSTRCCNTSKSLIGAEYIKVFKCPYSQKSRGLRSGNRARQFTGSPRPIHCSPKVWFRCFLTMHKKWGGGGAPSCMNHMCCR